LLQPPILFLCNAEKVTATVGQYRCQYQDLFSSLASWLWFWFFPFLFLSKQREHREQLPSVWELRKWWGVESREFGKEVVGMKWCRQKTEYIRCAGAWFYDPLTNIHFQQKKKLTEYLSLVHSRHWIYSFFSVE